MKIRERKSGQKIRLQVEFRYMPRGELAPKLVRFCAPDGMSRSSAIRWGEALRRELEAGRTVPQSKAGREAKAAEVVERKEAEQRAAREALTVRAWVDEYLADCEARRIRPTTIRLRRIQLRPLVETCGDRRIADVGVIDLQRLRRALSKLAASTAKRYQSIALTALRAAEAAGLRGPVPKLEAIRGGDAGDDVPERYADDEVGRLVDAAERLTDEHLGAVLLGLDAGLRAGEICGVRVEDVDLHRGIVSVQRTIVMLDGVRVEHRPKSGRARRVPLTPRLRAVLGRLAAASADGWLFHTHDGRPASRGSLDGMVHTLQRKAGLPMKGPHKLRHTFASRMLEVGASIEELRVLLGHASITQTARYTHASASSTRAAIDRLAAQEAPDRARDRGVTGDGPARPRLATV